MRRSQCDSPTWNLAALLWTRREGAPIAVWTYCAFVTIGLAAFGDAEIRQSPLGNAWHVGPVMFWVQVLVLSLLGRSCSSSCSSAHAAAAQTPLAPAPLDHNLICCRSNTSMWGWEVGLYAFSMPFELVGYRLTRS